MNTTQQHVERTVKKLKLMGIEILNSTDKYCIYQDLKNDTFTLIRFIHSENGIKRVVNRFAGLPMVRGNFLAGVDIKSNKNILFTLDSEDEITKDFEYVRTLILPSQPAPRHPNKGITDVMGVELEDRLILFNSSAESITVRGHLKPARMGQIRYLIRYNEDTKQFTVWNLTRISPLMGIRLVVTESNFNTAIYIEDKKEEAIEKIIT